MAEKVFSIFSEWEDGIWVCTVPLGKKVKGHHYESKIFRSSDELQGIFQIKHKTKRDAERGHEILRLLLDGDEEFRANLEKRSVKALKLLSKKFQERWDDREQSQQSL